MITLSNQTSAPNATSSHALSTSTEETAAPPWQLLPMTDHPSHEEILPNAQPEHPLAQPEVISSCSVTASLGEEDNLHLTTASFQVAVETP